MGVTNHRTIRVLFDLTRKGAAFLGIQRIRPPNPPAGRSIVLGGINVGLVGEIAGWSPGSIRPTGGGGTNIEPGSEYSGSSGAGASAGPWNEGEPSFQGSSKFGAIDDSRSLIAISAAELPPFCAKTGWTKTSADAVTKVATNAVVLLMPWRRENCPHKLRAAGELNVLAGHATCLVRRP